MPKDLDSHHHAIYQEMLSCVLPVALNSPHNRPYGGIGGAVAANTVFPAAKSDKTRSSRRQPRREFRHSCHSLTSNNHPRTYRSSAAHPPQVGKESGKLLHKKHTHAPLHALLLEFRRP